MNFLTKNVKYLAISVVSIGTIYLGYLQFLKFQKRLTRLERDVRVIQNNIESREREEHFVETKPTRRTVENTPMATTVPSTTKVLAPVEKNITLKNIDIEDADIDTLNKEGLDKLEALLENYETDDDESDYETETVTEDEEEVTTEAETTNVVETVEELHILNQYIHLNDEELYEVFNKNTCVELRDLLKKCGLSTGGKKEKLIQKLINHKKSITSISTNE